MNLLSHNLICRTLIICVLIVIQGCAQQSKTTSAEIIMDDVVANNKIEESRSGVPDAVNAAMLAPTVKNNNTVPKQRSDRFDVSVKDVPAADFFFGLTDGSDLNIVVQPDVTGTISLDLKKVTLDEVLDVIRDVYGYEFKKRNGIYTVYPSELRTKIFHVNYLDVKRVGISDTNVQIGKIEGSSRATNRQTQDNSSTETSAGMLGMLDDRIGQSRSGSTPGTRIITLNKTDFWSDVRRTIIAIVGGEREDRTVLVNPQAGMIVVKALPGELSAVREYLERSELSVKRQVMLEAKILEVRLNESFEAGVNWGAIGGQIINFENVSEFDTPTSISEAADNGNLFSAIIAVQDISTLLSLLETQGSVQVLSSPRISTVNNQKAVIRVGSDEFFVTGITDNTTSNASSTTSSPTIELDSFFSGIALDVTPQIAENGDVILHIHPVITKVTDQQKDLVLGDETFSFPLALRDIRESDTIVWAKNGQIVVLGGLMLEDVRETDGRRPVLSSIPGLSSLFKTRNSRSSKTELVILLQPIVANDETWEESVNGSRDNIKTLGEEYRELFSRRFRIDQ
jgi:MSHA biogenesis protein MshL